MFINEVDNFPFAMMNNFIQILKALTVENILCLFWLSLLEKILEVSLMDKCYLLRVLGLVKWIHGVGWEERGVG